MSEEVKDLQTESAAPSQTSSYRSIFKATSLFGGVQVYQIIISVIKSKFIAVLLGPLGVGIQGLYQSALHFIQSLTAMGLHASAVRDVSEANGTGDLEKVAVVVKTLRRLVWCTGLLGLLVVVAFSPVLSQTSFGDNKHIIPFICLSVTLLLDQICSGQKVVLQGTRRLKQLAMASAMGSTASLFVSVPLYYFYGIKGIVPTLILNSVTLLLLSWYYARRVSLPQVSLNYREAFQRGKGMLKMGLAMSWSNILVFGCAYVLKWFIRVETGTEAVGLYTAGFAIIGTYVGMVFNAISTDFYPRLAAVNDDNEKLNHIVNQQGVIAFLILAPILLVCIVFMPIVIQILYSKEFLGANDFVVVAAVGMMFKLGSWLISYQFIAKGESRLFVINETITNIYFLFFNLIGYRLLGLSGLGYAFLLSYLVYCVQVFLIARKKYGFFISKELRRIMAIQLVFVLMCFVVTLTHNHVLLYSMGSLLIVGCSLFSLNELNKHLDLISILKRRKK